LSGERFVPVNFPRLQFSSSIPLQQRPFHLLQLAGVALSAACGAEDDPRLGVLFRAELESQRAPHGRGNVYAPEIVRSGTKLRMWFGGQGRDGHDRIHLAESVDGTSWEQRGVVLEDPSANHCNDPSVVNAEGVLFIFFTKAGAGVTDEISVATSSDGVHWQRRGTALAPGPAGAWDSWSVGRPSVLHEGGLFRMWYDGRKDLPTGAPDAAAPKSDASRRHVGYATSDD